MVNSVMNMNFKNCLNIKFCKSKFKKKGNSHEEKNFIII